MQCQKSLAQYYNCSAGNLKFSNTKPHSRHSVQAAQTNRIVQSHGKEQQKTQTKLKKKLPATPQEALMSRYVAAQL
jgi:hypothetical protein